MKLVMSYNSIQRDQLFAQNCTTFKKTYCMYINEHNILVLSNSMIEALYTGKYMCSLPDYIAPHPNYSYYFKCKKIILDFMHANSQPTTILAKSVINSGEEFIVLMNNGSLCIFYPVENAMYINSLLKLKNIEFIKDCYTYKYIASHSACDIFHVVCTDDSNTTILYNIYNNNSFYDKSYTIHELLKSDKPILDMDYISSLYTIFYGNGLYSVYIKNKEKISNEYLIICKESMEFLYDSINNKIIVDCYISDRFRIVLYDDNSIKYDDNHIILESEKTYLSMNVTKSNRKDIHSFTMYTNEVGLEIFDKCIVYYGKGIVFEGYLAIPKHLLKHKEGYYYSKSANSEEKILYIKHFNTFFLNVYVDGKFTIFDGLNSIYVDNIFEDNIQKFNIEPYGCYI